MAIRKPWEPTVPMSSQPLPSTFNTINNGFMPTIENTRTLGAAPPPPPRPIQQPHSYIPTNYINPYYGPYSNNYHLNQSNMPMSNFSQLALDESRSAFSAIESIIQTFRSISNMFESTFTNIYTSFRAMTDLFEHFTRLRSELTTLYPLVLFWRFLKFLYHRLLNFFSFQKTKTIDDSWTTIYNSLQQNTESTKTINEQSSSLLIALFFLVSFGTPMLMLKFLNAIIKKRQTNKNWLEQQQKSNPACVTALYDYVARNPDELSFTRGTTIYLAPPAFQSSTSHWFLGTIDRIHTGLIPANYIQPIRTTTLSNVTLHPQPPVNANISSPHTPSTITNVPQSTNYGEEQTIFS